MNLRLIQTELVACALCQADGKNPDADVAAEAGSPPLKAWQTYAGEARRFIIAAETLERWTETLAMFRDIAPHHDGPATHA